MARIHLPTYLADWRNYETWLWEEVGKGVGYGVPGADHYNNDGIVYGMAVYHEGRKTYLVVVGHFQYVFDAEYAYAAPSPVDPESRQAFEVARIDITDPDNLPETFEPWQGERTMSGAVGRGLSASGTNIDHRIISIGR
ncbi:MAG: hypothetical protein KKD44_29500 [Proteobacteria bacterium]|nr:hypothetical protein [Pseudomonadota bacterium]